MLEFSHNGLFVAASLAISLMAAFSGLSMTRGASALAPAKRKLVVVLAALVLGGGIWSMHFVAMLGLRLPILFFYDPLYTLISALIAVLLVGSALLILHFLPRGWQSLTLAGLLVGVGIAVMHYVGMLGMELCAPVFSPGGVLIAAVAAVGLSVLAIHVSYGNRTRGNLVLGTVTLGLSVGAVHFIAMWGTGFVELPGAASAGPRLSNEVMAMGVTVAAFVICGLFLLTGVTFLEPEEAEAPEPDAPIISTPAPVAAPIAAPAAATVAAPAAAPAAAAQAEPAPRTLSMPYEREGRPQFIDAVAVAAVRAEGHYAILYSSQGKLFCPWSISEAEDRLTREGFIRAHRSYLVNPRLVTSFKRGKDSGLLYFEGVQSLSKVPVSRTRLAEVRAALSV
ncbi:MAG: LytTR family transcriptional regulator DNA-binding domain-containing protein [Roseivivax sp.]|nr:LytTR family transcriptional regulator DNA-binding domain-containing protein [Roseivivax sp.]